MNAQNSPQNDSQSPNLFSIDQDNRDRDLETCEIYDGDDSNQDILADEQDTETPPRDVRRITLFYSDGTFQEFYPPK